MIITLTGKPCSGKSSVAKVMVEKYGFRVYSVGEMFKEEAHKHNMTTEEFNKFLMSNPEYDNFLDNRTAELGKLWAKEKVIFDSRLAWHFIPHSFKVFMELDEEEMAKRLAESDRTGFEKYATIEEARQTLISRFNAENERYNKFYGIDNTDLNNYDLVITSKNRTPEDVAEEILTKYLEYYKLEKLD